MGAYQTDSSVNNQESLMTNLKDFILANGWTIDLFDTTNDKASFHLGNCYVHFQWDNSNNISMYQSLNYNVGNDPWNHDDDSGHGVASTTLTSERRVNEIGNGTFTKSHFFVHEEVGTEVVYVVLEFSPGLYRHFSFGHINKINTWVGGEFVAGHYWHVINDGSPNSTQHSVLCDGLSVNSTSGTTGDKSAATLHCEGLPNQDAASKWGAIGSTTRSLWGDRAANAHAPLVGGYRAGPYLEKYGWLPANLVNAFVPLIPIPIWYTDTSPPGDDEIYLLGYMHNVKQLNITVFDAEQEITVGGDTWMLFPLVRKRWEQDGGEESGNAGIAYKKVLV